MVTERQLKSPKRYLYEICDKLGMVDLDGNARLPIFTDPCAGGYKLPLRLISYDYDTYHTTLDLPEDDRKTEKKALGTKLLEAIIVIADDLDIKCWKPRLQYDTNGEVDGIAICVPRYEA